ncbi:MAG: Dihydrolipoyl dehydrogenase [candidate division BRC1 bacterium ADurb.BinA292]|nr:MAG: Dihydrolipoyl dehydrogenase [candidate division BRC1 bacterium ADurb.BinA292]
MNDHFNIAVIGTGPGGYIAALKAAQAGASVAVVEQQPYFGGTCLNWGCIPSKTLIASSELLHRLQHAEELGIEISGQVSFSWPKIQQRKDKNLNALRGGIRGLFQARKITPFIGKALLDGPGRFVVQPNDGSEPRRFTADQTILAVGSIPSRIPGWPTDPERVCTSDEALHWRDLPRRLLIVGGGVIGCEFACMLRPFGVEVMLVEMLPNLLTGLDGHLGEAMQAIFSKRGIRVLCEAKVEDLTLTDDGVRAALSNGEQLEFDRVLVATGRRANTADFGLERVGLTTDRGFIRVDDAMRTEQPDIYCIGDANGRCLLAHAASAQGVVAVESALGQPRAAQAPVPSCVYTFPEVAGVGLTQEAARERGIPIAIGSFPLGHLGKAMAAGETDGFVKVIRHRGSGELLGVHMLGHNVTEVIHAASVLIHTRATARDVAEMIFAHPTIGEGFHEALEDSLGACLHLPPRKKVRVTVGV